MRKLTRDEYLWLKAVCKRYAFRLRNEIYTFVRQTRTEEDARAFALERTRFALSKLSEEVMASDFSNFKRTVLYLKSSRLWNYLCEKSNWLEKAERQWTAQVANEYQELLKRRITHALYSQGGLSRSDIEQMTDDALSMTMMRLIELVLRSTQRQRFKVAAEYWLDDNEYANCQKLAQELRETLVACLYARLAAPAVRDIHRLTQDVAEVSWRLMLNTITVSLLCGDVRDWQTLANNEAKLKKWLLRTASNQAGFCTFYRRKNHRDSGLWSKLMKKRQREVLILSDEERAAGKSGVTVDKFASTVLSPEAVLSGADVGDERLAYTLSLLEKEKDIVRRMFVLHYVDGATHEQIGVICGMTETAVNKRINRTRSKILAATEKRYPKE